MTTGALTKGGNVALPPTADTIRVTVSFGHGRDVDAAALLLDGYRQVRSDADFVFFNQPASADGSVRHLGRETGSAMTDERLELRLADVPADVVTIALTGSVELGTFGEVGLVRLAITDAGGVECASYGLADAGAETAIILGEVYRRGDQWKVRAVGQGWATGLAGLATDFGVSIEAEPEAVSPVVPPPSLAPTSEGRQLTAPSPPPSPAAPVSDVPTNVPPSHDFTDPAPGVGRRFNTPPGWPVAPAGWAPPAGWRPPAEWPPAPAGWQFWVTDAAPTPPSKKPGIPLFGAKRKAQELSSEVEQLRSELARLGVLGVVELERRRDALEAEVVEQQARLRADLDRQASDLATQARDAASRQANDLAKINAEVATQQQRLNELRQQVVVTEESAILQEVGIYSYRHPLTDAAAYQAELARLRDATKAMARRDGGAIEAAKGWTVNGSAAQGRKMVNDFSKLMLRAYNAEADNLVRGLKPYKLSPSVDRLDKVADTIARLGKTMDIRVAVPYHRLRIKELELTADYLEKVAVEKEREREEKERLREERKVQQEIERERARLDKERSHYQNAHAALVAKGDHEGAARLADELADIERAMQDVDYRAANIRAGYVYVISNVGAFGERMVKVGMTRRLEPMDRVRELGDASVPFRFDVHALFFAEDAVTIENEMHSRLADRRVNRVNLRREFFYATPAEARDHLLALTGDLLQFEELPEALEFHQSRSNASTG